MGVKNLSKIIKKYCPAVISRAKLEEYKGKTIGIDASIFFYKFLYVSNKYNKPNYYLQMFLQQIMNMLEHDIIPIYIFDGAAPKEKETEKLKRSESRSQKKDELAIQREEIQKMRGRLFQLDPTSDDYDILKKELTRKQEKLKNKQDSIIHVTKHHTSNLKNLLTILAIPYIQGHGETDPLSAQLCKDKLLDGVMSEDMDYLPLETPLLLRTERTTFGEDFTEKYQLEYHYEDIRDGLGFTSEQFTDLCILCGCDYVDQLYLIGPLTAYKHIKEYKTIEEMLKVVDNKKHKVPENYMELVENARRCYNKQYTHRITKDMLRIYTPNMEKFKKFMNKFCHLGANVQQYYMTILSKYDVVVD